MEISLLPIVNAEGRELAVSENLDFSAKNEVGVSFPKPLSFTGKFLNTGNGIELTGSGEVDAEFTCDRCGEVFEDKITFELEEWFIKESDETNGDPDTIVLEGDMVDLGEIVYRNLFMNLPMKVLCKEDCKGLCAKCGANLNHGECGCDKREVNPAFADLDKLL